MKKNHALILWVILGAVVLWLLWRNRSTVAPTVFNTPLPNYIDSAYPNMVLVSPTLQVPSNSGCGCNPEASQYLSNSADAFNAAQDKIEQQLKDYTDYINSVIGTNTIQ